MKRKQKFSQSNLKKVDKKNSKPLNLKWQDEEISSDEEEDDIVQNGFHNREESDEEQVESAEQKRRRLAKSYLASIGPPDEDKDSIESDEDGADDDYISARLKKDRLSRQGRYFRKLAYKAKSLDGQTDLPITYLSGHKLSVTCVAMTNDEKTIYSGSKDNSVIQWDVESHKKHIIKPFWSRKLNDQYQMVDGEILAIAVTTDGKYIVSGGRDNTIRIYDVRQKYAEIKTLTGHRDAITSLCFKRESYSLFSGSLDRCIKHWDLNEMGYIETMFGHQDGIMSMDCWNKDRPISSSVDRSLRLWKVAQESHLVFRGPKSIPDTVAYLTEDTFVSGDQEGSLCLWKYTQKKPIATIHHAHGMSDVYNPRWICSTQTVKMSDLAVTGSYDGFLRCWEINENSIVQSCAIPMGGFINALAVSPSIIVAGLGREHRLGRWWSLKGNRNKIAIVKLPHNEHNEDEKEAEYEKNGLKNHVDSDSDEESADDD